MFKFLSKQNRLSTYYSELDSYACEEHFKLDYEKILKLIKKDKRLEYISIESKFNKLNYPVYDIDDENKLNDYINNIKEISSFIVIRSSSYDKTNHYWIIEDKPSKIKEIFDNNIWNICNDQNYASMCKKRNKLFIRGFYISNDTRPSIYKKYGEFSSNFEMFINSLFKYYDTYGFEISVLKSKNDEFLPEIIARERVKKINKINGI